MNLPSFPRRWLAMACLLLIPHLGALGASFLSPNALVLTPGGEELFVSCGMGSRVLVVDARTQKVSREIALPGSPSGLALFDGGRKLVVTCAAPESSVLIFEAATGKPLGKLQTGHAAMSPVVSPDGNTLFICCRFNNCIAEIDLAQLRERRRIAVSREPIAAALTPDGKFLLVANALHAGRADAGKVSAVVSVIDTGAGRVAKTLELPNGSNGLSDIRVSPDGKYAAFTHILARFHLPTTQLERGWINTNAETLIDLARMEVLGTFLLDSVDRGAGNPWGLAWSADGNHLVVAHSGTHEVSVIDWPGLVQKLNKVTARLAQPGESTTAADVEPENDLAFLVNLRERVRMPGDGKGPRAVAVNGQRAYVANYFSDTITVIDLGSERLQPTFFALGPVPQMDEVRKGELYFHDATLSFQGWQSCASCHPGDARVDGLNWDLLNDGIGNPKNAKSLLLSHKTPPAMSIGVRETAEAAVRAGLRSILFTVQPEEVPQAMDAYLKSLTPVPSPFLVQGKLSAAAERGAKVFNRALCATCHPPGLFTDLQQYDVGTAGPLDRLEKAFDTPTLVEIWRTAPYLHDGSAATIHEVITSHNAGDRHGITSNLTAQEAADLEAYLLSL